MTNIQAALGVAQLERIEQIVERKRAIAHSYTEQLKDLAGLELPVEEPWAKNVYWVYGIIIKENTGMNGKQFAERLAERGVDTRPFFLGMHEQPVFHKMGLFLNEKYPVAERFARQGLYIPSGLTIKESDINYVCDAIKDILKSH